MENDKDKIKRRSSILKPQKPQTIAEKSIASPSAEVIPRRVSFASSNFVKPFAADPEKNTIWDTTYEEYVDHTDSTRSSSHSQDVRDSTSIEKLKIESYRIWEETDLNISVFPSEVPEVDKENIFPQKLKVFQNKILPSSSGVDDKGEQNKISSIIEYVRANRTTIFDAGNNSMETTQFVPQTNAFSPSQLAQDMEFTTLASHSSIIGAIREKRAKSLYNASPYMMNETHNLDFSKTIVESKIYNLELKNTANQSNMEFTNILPTSLIPGNSNHLKSNQTQNMELTKALNDTKICKVQQIHHTNHTKLNQSDMEFTSTLPTHFIQSIPNQSKLNQTENMELTKTWNDTKICESEQKYNVNHTQLNNTNMEFTSILPTPFNQKNQKNSKLNQIENSEVTKVPNDTKICEIEQKYVDHTQLNNSNMEFTSILPTPFNQNNQSNSKSNQTENIHVTKASNDTKISQIDQTNNVDHTQLNNSNMEFTSILPTPFNQDNQNNSKSNQTDNIEVTKASNDTKICEIEQKYNVDHTQLNNSNMEFTSILPTPFNQHNRNNSKPNKTNNIEATNASKDTKICEIEQKYNVDYTQLNNSNMEFTSILTIPFNQNNQSNSKSNQTENIHVTKASNDTKISQIDQTNNVDHTHLNNSNMEFTSILPTPVNQDNQNNSKSNQADNVEVIKASNDTKICEIEQKYNVDHTQLNNSNMEFTSILPTPFNQHNQNNSKPNQTDNIEATNASKDTKICEIEQKYNVDHTQNNSNMEFTSILTTPFNQHNQNNSKSNQTDNIEATKAPNDTKICEIEQKYNVDHTQLNNSIMECASILPTPFNQDNQNNSKSNQTENIQVTKASSDMKICDIKQNHGHDTNMEFTNILSTPFIQDNPNCSRFTKTENMTLTKTLNYSKICEYTKKNHLDHTKQNQSNMELTNILPTPLIPGNSNYTKLNQTENMELTKAINDSKLFGKRKEKLGSYTKNRSNIEFTEKKSPTFKEIAKEKSNQVETVILKRNEDGNLSQRKLVSQHAVPKSILKSRHEVIQNYSNYPNVQRMLPDQDIDFQKINPIALNSTGNTDFNVPNAIVSPVPLDYIPEPMDCETFIEEMPCHNILVDEQNNVQSVEKKGSGSTVSSIGRKTMNFKTLGDESMPTEIFIRENYYPRKNSSVEKVCENSSNIVFHEVTQAKNENNSFHISSDSTCEREKLIEGNSTTEPNIQKNISVNFTSGDNIELDEIKSQLPCSEIQESNKAKPACGNIVFTQQLADYLTRSMHFGSTPTCFTGNLTNMSSGNEDTQQLINNDCISQPETFQAFLQRKEPLPSSSVSIMGDESISKLYSIHQNCSTSFQIEEEANFLIDVPVDESQRNSAANSGLEDGNETSSGSASYTRQSEEILKDFKKYFMDDETYLNERKQRREKKRKDLEAMMNEFKSNQLKIEEFVKNFKLPELNFDIDQQCHEKYEKTRAEIVTDEKKSKILAPKPLLERVQEAEQRNKKYWQLIKAGNDIYHFNTLFRSVEIVVSLHPELGIVYKVTTLQNLKDKHPPIMSYNAEVLQQKMKIENLILALGPKYDILALLDYVCMSVLAVTHFQADFITMDIEYGYSHKIRMSPDFCVVFEILNVELEIWWVISLQLSVSNMAMIEKVTAIHELGEPVNEKHIEAIVRGISAGGDNYFKMIIEQVEEYVQRIGRGIKYRRMGHN